MEKIRHRQLRAAYPPELVAADLTFSITLPSRRHLNPFLSNMRRFSFGEKSKNIALEKIKKTPCEKNKIIDPRKKQKIRGAKKLKKMMLKKTQKITCKKNQKIHTLKKSKKHTLKKLFFPPVGERTCSGTPSESRKTWVGGGFACPKYMGEGASRALSTGEIRGEGGVDGGCSARAKYVGG